MDLKKETIHEVGWRLGNTNIAFNEKQVRGVLFMPSPLPTSYKGQWAGQPVKLDLHAKSDKCKDTIHSLTIMRDSCSDHILKAKLVFKAKSDVLAWVEPYTGNLLDYLVEKKLGISEYQRLQSEFTLPTPNLDSALWQVIKGLEDLWKSGHYHGGFSLAKTYYVMEPSGIKIKLANFRKKEGTFKNNLAGDCTAVKDGLLEILKIATDLRVRFPNLDCCQLNGLIDVFRNIAPSDSESAFEAIKHQPFFWGKKERKEFFTCEIPLAFSKDGFFSKVENAAFITLPWGSNDFGGFLSRMNNYRSKKGLKPYSTSSRADLVKFISGLYTHELELKAVISVDVTVQKKHPGLCYRLYALLPHAKSTGT